MEQRYSHSLFTRTDSGFVPKIIEPDAAFTPAARKEFVGAIRSYYELLRGVVSVPCPYEVFEEDGRIIEVSEFCGPDCFVLISQDPDGRLTAEKVVHVIVEALCPIVTQPAGNWRFTIDSHPANWCVGVDQQLRYVDFCPPRFRTATTCLVGFPQPEDHDEYTRALSRYYTAFGVLRALRFSVVRAGGPGLEQVLFAAIKRTYSESLARSLGEHFAQLCAMRFRTGERLENLLEPLGIEHIDDVREIAMEVARKGFSSAEASVFLDKVLELTVGDFRIPLAARVGKIEEAKRFILSEARVRV